MKGISNRDVNPLNIDLVEGVGEGVLYKIADFSVAGVVDAGDKRIPLKSVAVIRRELSAPEVLEFFCEEKKEDLGYDPFKADVFSLGVIALKMMDMGVMRKDFDECVEMEQFLDRVEALKGENELKGVLLLMLNRDPSERPDFLQLNSILTKTSALMKQSTTEKKHFKIYLEVLEKMKTQDSLGLINLFNEHRVLYEIHSKRASQIKTSKFQINVCIYWKESERNTLRYRGLMWKIV